MASTISETSINRRGRAAACRRATSAGVLAGLVVVALAVGAVVRAPLAGAAASGSASGVPLTADEEAHLALLDAYRTDHGLAPLVLDARAQTDARAWARHLAETDSIRHADDVGPRCRAASSACSGWAENIGRAATHQRVFELYVGSPGHSANMRADRSAQGHRYHAGIGIHRTDGSTYVVHRFYACPCENDADARSLQERHGRDVAFARALAVDFLRRPAEEPELDALTDRLTYGVDRRAVASGLAFSDAWVGALVERYYDDTLGRAPDDAGRRYWASVIRRGTPPAEVAALFYASDEYHRRAGGDDRSWLRDLLRRTQGAEPSGATVDRWLQELRRSPRGHVAVAVYQDPEPRRRRVAGLYEALLGREPDRGGSAYWTAQLADGHDVRLAIELSGSDEYGRRAVARF